MKLAVLVLLSVFLVHAQECTPGSTSCTAGPRPMPYRRLGRSGLQVSALSYGNMMTFEQVGAEGALEIMKFLVDRGVNFFDTAEYYGKGEAEKLLGEAIRLGYQKNYWRREDLVISTKVFWGNKADDVLHFPNVLGLSRKHIIEGTLGSLKRLGLDYVDVLFCHRPDPDTPVEETVRAINYLIDQGKVFYWGTSEWSAEQIRAAHQVADRLGLIGPIVEQPEYSVLVRERFDKEYLPLYNDLGLGTTVWGALCGGVLSGKYDDGIPEDSRLALHPFLKDAISTPGSPFYKGGWEHLQRVTQGIAAVAKELECTTAQLALAWVLKNPHTTTILMGGKMKYLEENLGALEVVEKLSPEVMERIDNIVGNKPVPVISFRRRW